MATPFTLKAIAIAASCLLMSGSALAEAVAKYRVSVADLAVSDSVSAKNRKCVLESSLISNIENAIRNGRKFELLTRRADALAEIRKEQEFAKSGLTAADAAAEGQLSNAQSVIKVTVESFNFGRSASKVPNLEGKYKVSDNASISMSVQILDTTKGTVVGAFPVKASSSSGTSVSNGIGSPSGMKQGETFIVYEPGEDLIDPQTGENLGSAEMEVGVAKVVRVNPKVTILELTKGEPDSIGQGFILRRPVK